MENEGNFLVGILLGFFLGCLGVVVAFLMKGQKTLTGSFVGVGLSIALWTCAGIGLAVLQIALTNM